MSATAEKVRAILAAQLDIDADKITDTTDIAEDLGADSLDVVELMMSVEEEFEITIDEEAVKAFRTVADVAGYIDDNV
ncbi:MAG: acyl carrier protein [Oscillospiraceae bacterium]|jgi:acyl carrier protein|nr:acyl carrier protein [Oscillospiraceae bacterium]